MIQATLVFLVLLFFIFLDFPILTSTFIATIISVVAVDIPFSLVIIHMFGGINSSSLMAIPFLVLAGNIMMKVQITDKLVDFANAAVGRSRGGLGYVNVLASMLSDGIQGSGATDASVIRGILIPAMGRQGYDKDYAVAVTAGSSVLSSIIPPSIAVVLYSFYTEAPVVKPFLGGLVSGILIGIIQCDANHVSYGKRGYDTPITRFSMIYFIKAFWKSLGTLVMPLVTLLGIVLGIVTPTESRVLAIAYGLVYGFFISRKLRVEDLLKIIMDSAMTTAVVFMTTSVTGVLTNVLVCIQFQQEVLSFMVNTLDNPYLATLLLIIVFMILGRFLDPTIFVVMFAGIVVSVRGAFGFDLIHYGATMVIMMQINTITSPVGTFLFIACGVAGLLLEKSTKPLMPYISVILAVIALMIFMPGVVIFLPGLMR